MIDIPIAAMIRASARPMRPMPTTPNVLPLRSLIGVRAKHQSSLRVQAPSRTAAACSAGWRTSSSSSDVACCATESVP